MENHLDNGIEEMIPKKIIERVVALKLDIMTETCVYDIIKDAMAHRDEDRDEGDDWPPDYLDQFWRAFPPFRRQAKAKVGVKLAKIRKEGQITWAVLFDGVQKFAATNPGEYAPAPMVWLNDGRWDREYGKVQQNGKASHSLGGFSGLSERLKRTTSDADLWPDGYAGGAQPPNGR